MLLKEEERGVLVIGLYMFRVEAGGRWPYQWWVVGYTVYICFLRKALGE